MTRWWINFIFIAIAIVAGVGMFLLKYQVIEKEERLFRLHRQIAADKREIHMLQGDWASLNDPERLRALVQKQTNFKPLGANQVINPKMVPLRQKETEISADTFKNGPAKGGNK